MNIILYYKQELEIYSIICIIYIYLIHTIKACVFYLFSYPHFFVHVMIDLYMRIIYNIVYIGHHTIYQLLTN